ncbi:MAG: exonuclease subunit SbcD, partial [Victivallaceae bacterium]|nr:exonuclease subunit SbcD [Victivallaceae bacterium]
MKIIHTSDWHLGARLLDQDRSGDGQRFLDELLGIIEKERPDALIVSGDVFDTRQPGSGVQSIYYNFLGEVNRSGACAQVVITAGNHDSPSVLMEAHMPLDLIKVKVFGKVTDNPNDNIVVLDSADGSMKMAVAAVPFASGADLFNFARTAMP